MANSFYNRDGAIHIDTQNQSRLQGIDFASFTVKFVFIVSCRSGNREWGNETRDTSPYSTVGFSDQFHFFFKYLLFNSPPLEKENLLVFHLILNASFPSSLHVSSSNLQEYCVRPG